MVAGHLREQNGLYQIILSYKDSDGKRKTKSISTGLPVKGNKRKAESMLMDARQAVKFCIAHGRDYALTAERFGFTYQQIYGWVRKYHAAGLNSLREDRECSRELSDWVIENKHLKAVNLELEM